MKFFNKNKLCKLNKGNSSINITPQPPLYFRWIINGLVDEVGYAGGYINNVGTITNQSGYNISQFAEIPDGVTKLYHMPTGGAYVAGEVYDENKVFMKKIWSKGASSYKEGDWSMDDDYWTVEPGMKYIRTNSNSDGVILSIYCYSTELIGKYFEHESDKTYSVLNVELMKNSDLRTGDIVTTSCYSIAGDNGGATYDIMSYEEWWSKLPGDIKFIKESTTYKRTPVDEYGNHTLANGLVAKIRLDGEIRPEQYGAVGDGVTNCELPFVHLAAQVKSGNIVCGENKTYLLDLVDDNYSWDNPYRTVMCGALLGGQNFGKPIFCNVDGLTINGNGSLFTYANNRFGSTGMGMINFAGNMKNVEIYNCRFDAKGCTMWRNNKNSNHILFYAPGSVKFTNEIKIYHPNVDKITGTQKSVKVEHINIHDNHFNDCGAMYKTAGDYGGDHILIINPDYLDDLQIIHNEFYNYGRWVFAIDLGGTGERLTNIKFNNNKCIGANAYLETDADGNYLYLNEVPTGLDGDSVNTWRWRGLGLIDFEAKKCFSNVEMCDNYIVGSSGWAVNGCSRISKNFLIKDNYWRHCGGGYPYKFEFYSGSSEGFIIDNNTFSGNNGFKMGYFTKDLTVTNNNTAGTFRTFGIAGTIKFENNCFDVSTGVTTVLWSHEANSYNQNHISFEQAKEEGINVIFKNNSTFMAATFTDFTDLNKFNFINFDIQDNNIGKAAVTAFGTNFTVDPTLINNLANQQLYLNGCKISKPYETFIGDTIYCEKGQTIEVNLQKLGVAGGKMYKEMLVKDADFAACNSYNWSAYASKYNKETISIVCTESGYWPGTCQYGFRNACTHIDYIINDKLNVQENAYIWTDDFNLYHTQLADKINQIPTHTSGSVEYTYDEVTTDANGEETLTTHRNILDYVGKIGKFELVCTEKTS